MKNGTVVFPDRAPARLDVAIRDGRFAALLAPGSGRRRGAEAIDAAGKHVFPGLIDAHVHFGFGEQITEYSTETVYAAQGGFSTVLGYFLNNEAYDQVFNREKDTPESAATWTTASTSRRPTSCTSTSCRLRKDYGVTSFKYFMNFKGEEGRYWGWTAPTTATLRTAP